MIDTPDPALQRRIAERNELTRQCAARIVENADMGRPTADPETLAWARAFCAMHRPLNQPLTTGAPAA